MASPPDNLAPKAEPTERDLEIVEHLRRHPDFLLKHPDLLRLLTPPSRDGGDGVVDMQSFMIERLRGEIERLEEGRNTLVTTGRRTASRQGQVHDAVIAMLGAKTFENLIEVVTGDFVRLLDFDIATLCVESDTRSHACQHTGVVCLPEGTIDAILGADRDIRIDVDVAPDERLFGAGTGLVCSAVLLRLRLASRAPACLLALGSRRDDAIQPGDGTELFGFLARALEHSLHTWLDLPG
jgi:uncharacterized protein YigA (DUF484 family)